ncbi:MAG: GAF and ANTAR domain-containing protein [Nocardioidaceae bacterium]
MTQHHSHNAPTSRSLVAAFTEMASHIHSSDDHEASLRNVTESAVHAIGGCDAVSLSLLEKTGPVTVAATDAMASAGDDIQYAEHEGPCLDAAIQERSIYTPNLAVDRRWPLSAARMAGELGVQSMFSCRLALGSAPRETLGGINMYSTHVDGFTDDDQMLAILLASLTTVVFDASRRQASLRAAIESRRVIGEAVGILREQSNVSSEEAFEMLVHASQRMNVKLRRLAQQITEGSRLTSR